MAILGAALPYTPFLMWLLENGVDVQLFVNLILENRISLFAWLDVIVSAVTLLLLAYHFRFVIGHKGAALVGLLTLSIGVSCGSPVLAFLLLRCQSERFK